LFAKIVTPLSCAAARIGANIDPLALDENSQQTNNE
jgi:hypothetical protein